MPLNSFVINLEENPTASRTILGRVTDVETPTEVDGFTDYAYLDLDLSFLAAFFAAKYNTEVKALAAIEESTDTTVRIVFTHEDNGGGD